MDLKDFLLRFPEAKLADVGQEQRLMDFFHRVPMTGKGMALQYLRGPTFSAFLNCQSHHHYVFYADGSSGEIEGAGTIVFRPAMVHGKRETVGYLGDLRVDNIRRWGRYWRDFYFDLMKEASGIREFEGVRYFYTGILRQNQKAQKALGQSKVGYHPWHTYQMVNVLAPLLPISDRLEQKTWAESNPAELWDFHREANRQKPLGWVFDDTHHEGEWRLRNWPDFSLSQGLTIRDAKGIMLSGAFWSPGSVKKIMIQGLPATQRFAHQLLRPILPLPLPGEELRCLYLTMFDRREGLGPAEFTQAFRQLVDFGLKRMRETGHHCVSLANFSEAPCAQALGPYVKFKTDLDLYLVNPMRNPVADFGRQVPGFEMGLV